MVPVIPVHAAFEGQNCAHAGIIAGEKFDLFGVGTIFKGVGAAAGAKKQAVQDKVLKSNQDAAARGDAYGLMRMGERYRDGEGVEKDLDKARTYLKKAADAGSPTAAEELQHLPSS